MTSLDQQALAPVKAPEDQQSLQWRQWFIYGAYALFAVSLLMASYSRSIAGLKPGEIFLAVFVGAVALRRVLTRDYSFVTTPLDFGFWLLIIVGSWIPLLVLEVRGIYFSKDILRALIGPVLYYLWYRAFLETVPVVTQLKLMTRAILIVLTTISIIGILQFIPVVRDLVEKALLNFYYSQSVFESITNHRPTSVVASWEVLAALAAYALILINQIQTSSDGPAQLGRNWNYILIGMAVINIVALAATQSIAGIIALMVGYALAWVLNRRLARVTTIVLIAGAVGIALASPFLIRRLHGSGSGLSSFLPTWQERFFHWQVVFSTLVSHSTNLIVGVQPAFTYPVSSFNSTESLYLLLLYRGGLIYLLAFVAFMIISLRYLLQLRRQTQGFAHHVVTAVLIIFSVNYLIDLIDAHFVDAGEWQLLMTFLAMAAGIGMQTQQQGAPANVGQPINVQEQPTLKRLAAITLPAAMRRTPALRAGALLGIAAILLSSALAWYHGRHTPPPPQTLAVPILSPTAPNTLENYQKIGTTAWQIDKHVDTTYLQGYAGSVSVQAGDTLPLYISARAPIAYNLDVYRIGWYMGLGGRLYASAHNLHASAQGYWTPQDGLSNCPTCFSDPTTHLIEARWADSYDLATGANWLSGVYLIKLTATGSSTRAESYIPFVVRNDASQSTVLVNLPVNTYEADNIWGGYNLNQHGTQEDYTGTISPDRATQVSFDRPFAASSGAGDFLNWDIHGVRYFERAGLDVSYTTNVDVASHPEQLQQHRVFVTLGHDAYWTNSIYQGLTTARDQGVSMIFLGGGDGHWQARLEPDRTGMPDRTLVSYQVSSTATDPTMKLSADPEYHIDRSLVTAAWSDPVLNRPENALLGLMQGGYVSPDVQTPTWVASPLNPSDQLVSVSGISPGQSLSGNSVGDAFDTVANNGHTPNNLVTLGSAVVLGTSQQVYTADTAYYLANTSLVFDAGSAWWEWALDEFTIPGASQQNITLGNLSLMSLTTNAIRASVPDATFN
jgi:hypothetical protein